MRLGLVLGYGNAFGVESVQWGRGEGSPPPLQAIPWARGYDAPNVPSRSALPLPCLQPCDHARRPGARAPRAPVPQVLPPHLPTLVVGDGDLSFSVALNRLCGLNRNLVATVHDTYEALRAKYGPNVDPRIAELQAAAHVQFGVDARCMSRAALAPGPPPEPRPGSAAAAAPGPVAPDQPRVTDGGPPAPAPAERAQAPDGRRLPPSAAARPDAPEPAMDPPPIPRPPQKRPRSTSPGPDPRRDTPTPAAPCGRGAAAAAHDAHAGVGPGGDGARAPSPAPDSAAPTPPAQPSTAAPPAAAPGPDGAAFSRIVFQFPLAPPTSREEYAATPAQAIIIVNRQLLLEFLWECERLLQRPDGAVFITNKDVHPYTQWRIHDRLCW